MFNNAPIVQRQFFQIENSNSLLCHTKFSVQAKGRYSYSMAAVNIVACQAHPASVKQLQSRSIFLNFKGLSFG